MNLSESLTVAVVLGGLAVRVALTLRVHRKAPAGAPDTAPQQLV